MGDRTRIQCWIPKEIFETRQEDIEAALWEADAFTLDDDGKYYYCEEDEVNYGGSHECDELTKKKIPFIWQNDNGGSYGAGLAVSAGDGKKVEIPIDFEDDYYIRVSFEKGVVVPRGDDLALLTKFAAAMKTLMTKYGVMLRFDEFVK